MQNRQDYIRETAKLIREAHRQIPGPEFVAAYGVLVDKIFPGGYSNAMQGIQESDAEAVEAGLVFVEVRPYFFRSQYIRTHLIRLLKHAKLSSVQEGRFKQILDMEHESKIKKNEKTFTI